MCVKFLKVNINGFLGIVSVDLFHNSASMGFDSPAFHQVSLTIKNVLNYD